MGKKPVDKQSLSMRSCIQKQSSDLNYWTRNNKSAWALGKNNNGKAKGNKIIWKGSYSPSSWKVRVVDWLGSECWNTGTEKFVN